MLIVPKAAAVNDCSGAMRLHKYRSNKRLKRSDRPSWCYFNGKCGRLPRSPFLKDPRLSNAKTPVNIQQVPIEFAGLTPL